MSRVRFRSLVAAVTTLVVAGLVGCTTTSIPRPSSPTSVAATNSARPDIAGLGEYRVGTVDYDLGDTAITYPWFWGFGRNGFPDSAVKAPIELAATVHYPIDTTATRHPLVEIEHGLWYTCADRSVDAAITQANDEIAELPVGRPSGSEKPAPDPRAARWQAVLDRDVPKLGGWPCSTGIPALPSYRGYDYLGTYLASHGIVTVSISENGVTSGDQNTADRARAAVADEHLALWAQLDRTGAGPLAGHFVEAGTHTPVTVDFRDRIDLTRVGLIGHSRGGRGVMWQAADDHRAQLPTGVRIRAVATLAAAAIVNIPAGDAREQQYLTTRIPVMAWIGTCDGAVSDAGDYLSRMRARTHAELIGLTVHGANHDYLNTQWSPASGQVQGSDDATHPKTERGQCRQNVPGAASTATGSATAALTEQQERRVATTYVGAFLLGELNGDPASTRLINGQDDPSRDGPTIDLAVSAAQKR